MNSQLIIRPLEAKLIHNTDLFMKMDPYCKFKIGKEKVKSKVHKKGGKTPVWTDTLTLKREIGDDILKVEVKDKDTFTRDDVVGKGILTHSLVAFMGVRIWDFVKRQGEFFNVERCHFCGVEQGEKVSVKILESFQKTVEELTSNIFQKWLFS